MAQMLVGDDDVCHLLGGDIAQGDLGLHPDQLLGDALLTLLQALAHADDDLQTGVQSGQSALVDGLVGLCEILTALGVTNDDVLDARSTSISALISPVNAPDFSKWTFSAPTWMLVPLVFATAVTRSV